jgi:nitrogen fixation protein NifU and related proteins
MAFDDLYQEIILDHAKNPRNKENLDFISDDELHENPTCGDAIKLAVDFSDDGKLIRVRFDGDGCAISTASASMMTELVEGKTKEEAILMVSDFVSIMRDGAENNLEEWGDIMALEGVIKYPLRVKCATLPWHAMEHALGL